MVKAVPLQQDWYQAFLVCPDCSGTLSHKESAIRCSCGYSTLQARPLDLRPHAPGNLSIVHSRLIGSLPSDVLDEIDTTPPVVTYAGPQAFRDSSALMSEINRYLGDSGRVLDLGCGPRDQSAPVEFLGYEYVGLDYTNENADILGDAHAIPFSDSTFDCVLSYAVLEHLHDPAVAVQEIERVLKPGGLYIGTVSQGEPFHASYFHHTAWGFISLVRAAPALRVSRIWATGDTLGSLGRMGGYPRVIRALIRAVQILHEKAPFLAPRKMKWSKQKKRLDSIHRAGSLGFVVCKREDD